MQRRAANEAETLANVAWARLQARFPGIARTSPPLAVPPPLAERSDYWRARILEQSDDLRLAHAQLRKTRANADRVRAERIPDPTFGV